MKKKTEETEEKEFLAGTESDEQFGQVVSLLAEWLDAGIVEIELDNDGDIRFKLPKEMDELLKAPIDIDLPKENILKIIKNEIPALVAAAVDDNPKQRLIVMLPDELHSKIDEVVSRCEEVSSKIISDKMKQRILLRKVTKGFIIGDIQTQPGTYHVRTKVGQSIDVPYISMEFVFSRPSSGQMMTINPRDRSVRFEKTDDIKVTVDMHKEDIAYLVEELKQKISEEE